MDSSCSGSSGSTSLTATNASFAAGQQILIHKTRGNTTTTAGTWEVNYIVSYSAGTITTLLPLENSYQDSGADQSQVLVLKQYSGATISGTLTAKAWDGDAGGILAFLCNGKVDINGTIQAGSDGSNPSSGMGFRRGTVSGGQGEGTVGDRNGVSTGANGNGGGGSSGGVDEHRSGGGGGGHSAVGGTGTGDQGTGGTGGTTAGTADLTTMVFGGGGGAGNGTVTVSGGEGGTGGGIVFIIGAIVVVTGIIKANGSPGQTGGTSVSAGGGGAGGSIFIKARTTTLGSALITATAGSGASGGGSTGGNGSAGRIRVEACSLTGTTNPAASEQVGGFNFCGGVAAII